MLCGRPTWHLVVDLNVADLAACRQVQRGLDQWLVIELNAHGQALWFVVNLNQA